MLPIPVVILSVALFLALIANLALKPAFSTRLTAKCMIFAALAGLVIYGVGFAETTGSLAVSILRTPLSVTRMFVGINELSAIEGSTPVRTPMGVTIFWLVHMLAFFSTASAALVTIGAEVLRRLRLLLLRRGDLVILFGINDNAINVGKECLAQGSSVVFIAETADGTVIDDLNGMGMSVITGQDAVGSGKETIRTLHPLNRKITVFALDPSVDKNLYYALALKDALRNAGVAAENTRITLPGEEEIITSMLQVTPEEYGYGYVHVFDEGDLASRAMLRICPPWDLMEFDDSGRATEIFDCVVIGFGRFGQAALKRLVMNGQFAGSAFHAAVFSNDVDRQSGYLFADCPELQSEYDIEFFGDDARSRGFYTYLRNRLGSVKYIAVCTGNDEMNAEICDTLMLYLKRVRAEHICVVQCTKDGVRYQEAVGAPLMARKVRSMEMLSAGRMDRDAILINSAYDSSDRTDWEKWVACDSFGKMSSRASAAFIPALVKASGCTEEEITEGQWEPDGKLLDVLGETEHMRWCAFHFANGYRRMSEEELSRNIENYVRCREKGLPLPRITKNAEQRTHACLIPYDQLDALSERENAVTGKNTDYRRLDINNVLMIPRILEARKGAM